MTQKDLFRISHENGVVELRLNRGPVNALSAEFLIDFADLIDDLSRDSSVRAIVLTSEFKVLSAGLDLKEAQDFDIAAQNAIVKGLNVGFLSLFACPRPVVVAINGAAIAGGLFFVLASDLRLSGQKAKFGLAEVRVGADFPVGPLEIARATLTPDARRYLMLTGLPISAERARQLGIVDDIIADDQLREEALARAADLAGLPPLTFASIKSQLRRNTIETIEAAIASGGNAPDGGWFSSETKAAMKRMIGN